MIGLLAVLLAAPDATPDAAVIARFELAERIRGAAPAGWVETVPSPEVLETAARLRSPKPDLTFESECGYMTVGLSEGGDSLEGIEAELRGGDFVRVGRAGGPEQHYVRAELAPHLFAIPELEDEDVTAIVIALPHPVQTKLVAYFAFGPCARELGPIEASIRSLRDIDARYNTPSVGKPRKTLAEEITGYIKVTVGIFFVVSLIVLSRWHQRKRRR